MMIQSQKSSPPSFSFSVRNGILEIYFGVYFVYFNSIKLMFSPTLFLFQVLLPLEAIFF